MAYDVPKQSLDCLSRYRDFSWRVALTAFPYPSPFLQSVTVILTAAVKALLYLQVSSQMMNTLTVNRARTVFSSQDSGQLHTR